MASSGMDEPCEGVMQDHTSDNYRSSSSPKLSDDITTSTHDKAMVNRHVVNRRSEAHDSNGSKLILPLTKNDIKGRPECRARKKGASPVPDFKKEKKDRGPASCLFRGHDHSQRILEEFDNLRNLQGKSLGRTLF